MADPNPAKHVNFNVGMVLGVDDFTQEFAYLSGRDQWLARDQIDLFRDDMTALRVIAPDEYIGAVESIPLVLIVAVPMMIAMPWLAKTLGIPDIVAGAWLGGTLAESRRRNALAGAVGQRR